MHCVLPLFHLFRDKFPLYKYKRLVFHSIASSFLTAAWTTIEWTLYKSSKGWLWWSPLLIATSGSRYRGRLSLASMLFSPGIHQLLYCRVCSCRHHLVFSDDICSLEIQTDTGEVCAKRNVTSLMCISCCWRSSWNVITNLVGDFSRKDSPNRWYYAKDSFCSAHWLHRKMDGASDVNKESNMEVQKKKETKTLVEIIIWSHLQWNTYVKLM